jgi:hypothetical protein
MQIDTIGEVVATRKLYLVDEPSKETLVKIGKPQPSNHNDYCCPVQVTGIGEERVYGIFGVDSVQAVELGMRFLGSELQRLNTRYEGRIRWGDAPNGWFGLPMKFLSKNDLRVSSHRMKNTGLPSRRRDSVYADLSGTGITD